MGVVREFVSYGCIVIYKNCTEDDEKPALLGNWDPNVDWKIAPFEAISKDFKYADIAGEITSRQSDVFGSFINQANTLKKVRPKKVSKDFSILSHIP